MNMNTLISNHPLKRFIYGFALLVFSTLFVTPDVCAQNMATQTEAAIKPRFQAYIRPVANKMEMMLHIANPDEEKVTLTILDHNARVVCQKTIGNQNKFYGAVDLSILENGKYNMVIASRNNSYARAVSIREERFAVAH